MKDTNDLPEGTEQAKQPKPRTPARPKAESATSAGQDQNARPPVRRRTSPPANTATTSVPATQNGSDITTHSSIIVRNDTIISAQNEPETPAATAPVNPPVQRAETAPTQRTEAGPVQPRPNNAPRQNYTQGQRPNNAPGQRTEGSPRPPYRFEGGQTQPRPNFTPVQRPDGGQRSGNPPMQQRSNGPQQQRQGGAPMQQRPAGPNAYPQRLGNNPTPQSQRQQGTFAPRPANQSGTTYPPATQQRSGGRPGGSAPNGTRPAYGNNHNGNGNGQGGHGRPGANGGRPGTPTQRPQERRAAAVKEKVTGPIALPPQIMVKDLADLLKATPNEVIKVLIGNKIFANINQVIDYDKAALVAQDLGFEPMQSAVAATPAVQRERTTGALTQQAAEVHGEDENLVVIPPVVTIMGHVDHGKTTLLDTIRKTKVAASEAGGITQHIGAYQVEVQGKKITFLDTPGHEAFTAMRARGAQVTHIAVIVVAADDGVMPQTREAIDHAKAANVPIIIALNKIDKLDANPDYVKQQLAEIDVVVEDYGGDVICVPVSARKGTGIDDLLEMILLVAEIQDIRANPNQLATGTIIEARLEKSSGPTATVLVANGTLKMGDNIVVGSMAGKVRAMFNDRGKRIQKAPPSTPVSILGLPEVPRAGDHLEAVAEERTARQLATQTAEQRRSESRPLGQVSLDTRYTQMQEGKVKELNIVLKCDVQGSAEAIKNALSKIGDENLKVRLIHEGIGNISETDVHLAGASDAIIISLTVIVFASLRYPKRIIFRFPAALLAMAYIGAAIVTWHTATGASLVSLEPEFALPEDIQLMHETGAAALTTLDRPEDAARLLSWGLDVLESGDPAMVVAAIRTAGAAS